MEYRCLPHDKSIEIGVIGLGTAALGMAGEKTAAQALEVAVEGGINYIDLASGGPDIFPAVGSTLSSVRKNMLYQIHFGADYTSGKYGWTTDAETVKKSIDWQLKTLKTDYIDFGFIHCMDEDSDWDTVRSNGLVDLILSLKKQGTVRHIGLSSHTPSVAKKIIETGILDMLMFSINPAYDYRKGEYARGSLDERTELYRLCGRMRIGISVMKPFCGGQLLDEKTSPLGIAFTRAQLLQYALDMPAVITTLPGAANAAEVRSLLSFFDTRPEERDYSALSGAKPAEIAGRCVYCNHCQPCPMGIDVGLVNKYYDLHLAGDELAREHYLTLEKHAGDCISCGHCNSRCPFSVDQMSRMEEIGRPFGL